MKSDELTFRETLPEQDTAGDSGRILRGVGGLYTVLSDATGEEIPCRAKGAFRHEGLTPLPGDRVRLAFPTPKTGASADSAAVIREILPRTNALIRPAMANLDLLFVTVASASPTPMTDMIDKQLAIAEHNGIRAAVVIGKSELNPAETARLTEIYHLAGYPVFPLSCRTGEGIEALRCYINQQLPGHIAAFSGASGVGKSTLMNSLFPGLALQTGELSRKIGRGKHTTRQVELYRLSDLVSSDGAAGADVTAAGFLADTPGFSMLDFERFDFFGVEDLPYAMREFRPCLGNCRYTSCTHTRERAADCAVVRAMEEGRIAPSRHQSYLDLWRILKEKPSYARPCGKEK